MAKNRSQRDQEVIGVMVKIYCRGHHKLPNGTLCAECAELLDYASRRIKKCPLGESKRTSCRLCKIHCYDRDHRERVRRVMKYAGPRMIFYNPIMAISHLLYERRG